VSVSLYSPCISDEDDDGNNNNNNNKYYKSVIQQYVPVQVAARSKTYIYGRSYTAIVVSSPTGGMDVCCVYCVLSGRGLCDELITRPE
jgi:hypothetical protein